MRADGAKNQFGLETLDHVTSNFQTMNRRPLDGARARHGDFLGGRLSYEATSIRPWHRIGPQSVVMWLPGTNVKFANNEPARPFFKTSQINLFNEDMRGDGVQARGVHP